MSLDKQMISARIDNTTRIPEEYYKTICPAPKSVKIELTSRCDLRCFFCATSHKLRHKGDMDFDFYKRIVEEMRNEGVQELGLFYLGESLLYPELAEAVHYAKKVIEYPYVFLTTNGRRATPETLEILMENGLDSLKFSFNSSDQQQYKYHTGVDSFDEVCRNIREARTIRDMVERKTGHRCGLYASSIKYDNEQEAKMDFAYNKYLKDFVDEYYLLPLYGQAGYTAGVRGTKPVAGNIGRIGAIRESLPCWALFTEGHISWDGVLTGCCFSHEKDWDFGDLNKMSFMQAWNSKEAQSLRDANLRKNVTGTACEKCIAVGT
jgi:MoaA/NifB/PqqE/SkfB family radical SAM enzyme